MAQGTSSGTSSRRHGRNEHDTSSISSSRYADAEWEAKEVMHILRLIMDFSDVLSVTARSEILTITWGRQNSPEWVISLVLLCSFPPVFPIVSHNLYVRRLVGIVWVSVWLNVNLAEIFSLYYLACCVWWCVQFNSCSCWPGTCQ